MKITIDKNHLLVIENESIPQVKEYTYNVGGYLFSDFDKGVLVLNKKIWKVINLKNLSDNMSVVYILPSPPAPLHDVERGENLTHLDMVVFEDVLKIFHAFDEESGQTYFFLPTIQEKELSAKNDILQKIGMKCALKKTEKGIVPELKDEAREQTSHHVVVPPPYQEGQVLSFLFGLVVLYGKFEGKAGELASIKIQLPLFGQYLKYSDALDQVIGKMQEHGIFMKSDKLQTSNGIVYQISCTDYEVLELFAKWYEPVEKFGKITKRDFIMEMKAKLLEFVKNDSQIPEEGKSEVLALLEKSVIKLLVK